jgi:hydroxymethylpyrimidine/phosphomethylpyrimidine kinase
MGTQSFDLPVDLIRAQLEAVFDDFDVAAVKTGMLSSAEIVGAVAGFLRKRKIGPLVVDPVMISKSGYRLLKDDAIDTLKHELLPLAMVIMPNLHEAELLAGMNIESVDAMRDAAARIRDLGCKNVLVKGGHANFDRATDILFDGKRFHSLQSDFIDTKNLHGTGCTFSAAIAARLALGEPLLDAVRHAKHYITQAIRHALTIGRGHGPTHHFYFLRPSDCLQQ